MSRRLLAAFALLAALGFAVTACSSGGGGGAGASATQSGLNDHTPGTYQGFGMTPPQPRPAFTLTDTTGQPFSFATATQGKPTFLYFGYTHCPDVCPTTMADIGQALTTVPAALRAQAEVVFVTTDVKRDTGPAIASWLGNFDGSLPNKFIGLTGSQAEVDAAQAGAHVTLAQDDGQTHSAQVLLYGADDYARVSYVQSDNEAEAMAHDLPLVAKK